MTRNNVREQLVSSKRGGTERGTGPLRPLYKATGFFFIYPQRHGQVTECSIFVHHIELLKP